MLCALYIEEEHRGNGLGKLLIEQVKRDAHNAGFQNLYLCTTLDAYYEKFGFRFLEDGFYSDSESCKIFEINHD